MVMGYPDYLYFIQGIKVHKVGIKIVAVVVLWLRCAG